MKKIPCRQRTIQSEYQNVERLCMSRMEAYNQFSRKQIRYNRCTENQPVHHRSFKLFKDLLLAVATNDSNFFMGLLWQLNV